MLHPFRWRRTRCWSGSARSATSSSATATAAWERPSATRAWLLNGKKLRRLMRENDLQPKRRRRYVITTDSDHAGPIFPDLAKDVVPDRPNQLWVADLTYVAIPGGFVYLAAILDAWSRKVVGYAISRSMDARIAVAALKAAIKGRKPPKGCIHHSDRGSQAALK